MNRSRCCDAMTGLRCRDGGEEAWGGRASGRMAAVWSLLLSGTIEMAGRLMPLECRWLKAGRQTCNGLPRIVRLVALPTANWGTDPQSLHP